MPEHPVCRTGFALPLASGDRITQTAPCLLKLLLEGGDGASDRVWCLHVEDEGDVLLGEDALGVCDGCAQGLCKLHEVQLLASVCYLC